MHLESSKKFIYLWSQLIRGVNGHTQVHYYDWSEFLKYYYRAIPSNTNYHIFIIKHPAMIVLKQHSQAAEETISIGVHPVPQGVLPESIYPKGLDLDRQWYLYDKIRPFCSSMPSADITCPIPSQPKPSPMAPERIASSTSVMRAGTKRKPVTCSSCEGHTKRTCPLKK